MGFQQILWVVLVTMATVYYLNIPPPELSDELKSWLNRGDFLKYKKQFNIFYVVENGIVDDGSTLLLIHGFPTSGYDWIKVLDGLKEMYETIIIPDMLGFGFSDKPKPYNYLITEQADILEAILESLLVKDVSIMAHDYGDTVALELLHRHNSGQGKVKVINLCMLNGGVFPETNFPLLTQKLLLVPVLGDVMCHISFYAAFKRGLSSTFGPTTQPSEKDMRDFYAAVRHKDGNTVFSRLIHYITQRNLNKDRWVGALQNTKVPVHMIYGPSDPVNPAPGFVNHYKSVVPKPSISVLNTVIGHYPQWEDPGSVLAFYKTFLQKHKQS